MALSGEQWTISYSGREAVIVAVGGGLRSFTVNGQAYVDSYDDEELAPGWAGHVLAPWPGRLADGEYTFEGDTHTVAVNEPANRTALHGLVGWQRWRAADVSDSSVTVECDLPAQPGYPFQLVFRTRWSVGPYGVRAVHTVSNVGMRSCPLGLGVHPYITLPGSAMETWNLRVPAKRQLITNARQLPAGETQAGFTEPTPIADSVLDTTFADLERDADGIARVELSNEDSSRAVAVWVDDSFNWLHLYTGDDLEGDRRRRCLAVEPMSCPPDALRSGIGVTTLTPGEAWSGTWGISPKKV